MLMLLKSPKNREEVEKEGVMIWLKSVKKSQKLKLDPLLSLSDAKMSSSL